MKRILTSLIFCLATICAFAQTGTVSGTLNDGDTGEPIIGGTVIIQGTSTGTVSDFDGSFTVENVDAGTQTLIISYIGYETQEIGAEVNSGQNTNIGYVDCLSSAFALSEK